MIGHSVGEYVAATLAGVMELDDALRLIARRGRLIAALPRGSMLAVMAAADALERLRRERGLGRGRERARITAVLSGPEAAIDRVESALAAESLRARRLHTSHAFHSSMMDPILAEFEAWWPACASRRRRFPFVSTLTGGWADGDGDAAPVLERTAALDRALRRRPAYTGRAGQPDRKAPRCSEVGPGRACDVRGAHGRQRRAGAAMRRVAAGCRREPARHRVPA